MKKHPLSALVFDFDLYPRGSVDSQHATEIASAVEAGASMPPLVIDKKSKRVIDGFHRGKAYRRVFGEDHEVECIEKSYKNEEEMLLDAMRYNVSHGRALTSHDKAHCLLLCEKMNIEPGLVAQVLHLTPGRVSELRANRVGMIGPRSIALKRTIRHMGGKQLTPEQGTANEKLSGMNQMFYVNQLITLIENELIDSENKDLISGLGRLYNLLAPFSRMEAA